MITKGSKSIGVALGGGFARAGAQIGALKVLDEYKIPISSVSGVSAGAIVGAAYVTGNLQRFEDYLMNLKPIDYIKWFSFSPDWHSLASGEAGETQMRKLTEGKDFSQTNIPFCVPTVDIVSGKLHIINKGNIATGVRVACSLPGILTPHDFEEKKLLDAGILIDVDSDTLYNQKIDYVIGIKVSQGNKWLTRNIGYMKRKYLKIMRREPNDAFLIKKQKDVNIITSFIKSYHMVINRVVRNRYKNVDVDFLVWPETGFARKYDVKAMKEFIEVGESEMRKRIPYLLKDLEGESII